ncbi:LysR family transcriptional regulator [Collinsella aerofaciens]|uniref:LysR family transcriptional regulator n=1 Tax=Collinsella aerofaciens TaxID=74426 RepID=UPI0018A9EE8E|nr:LysR family transcriptional regulator [Collinsella aerofaciens]
MTSRYQIVCMVVDRGSLKGAADEPGYTQSAVSQAVKALERELGTTLIERGKQGVTLTRDGKQYLPYLRQIVTAEAELEGKRQELLGLSSTDIRIATFTNVSRTVLPRVIRDFGTLHPGVHFTLKQGDYTRNAQWVHDGVVDFCFTARGFTAGLEKRVVYHDELVALLPAAHPLTAKEKVTLADLASEPFVLLDEGEQSLVLDAFAAHGLSPYVTSEVTDDYTIMAMVEEGLGVSMLYRRTVEGMRADIRVRPIVHAPSRDVVAAWRSWDTMPIATRRFIDYMSSHIVN